LTDLLEQISDSIVNFDSEGVMENVKEAMAAGLTPQEIIEKCLSKGLRIVGKMFEEGEVFLTHLIAAAEPAKRAITELLEPEMRRQKTSRKTLGKVILGTVEGDIHDIGKNIVSAMLFAAGFEVYDLGVEVPPKIFVEKAKQLKADVVGASALLTTTMHVQREIVRAFDESGLRKGVKLIFGGAPVTPEWIQEIGADGFARDSVEAVSLVKMLLGIEEV